MAGTYARTTGTLVIGGGPGGYMAAIRLGQLGQKAILVERDALGGECLNRGCIPSKALIHAAELYHHLRTDGPTMGVLADHVAFDLSKAMAWKDAVVQKETQGVQSLLKSAGVTVLQGEARFTSPRSAELSAPDGGRERIDFASAIIATGAVPIRLPGFETDGKRVVNPWELLSLPKLPSSMVILGGGVSGCELGEFLAHVGVRVTIVEMMDQLLPGIEADLSRELSRRFDALGIRSLTSAKATSLERSSPELSMSVEIGGTTQTVRAEMLFVTVGKRADTRSLGLEDAGVHADERTAFISVDDRMRSNVPHIYAVGDAARAPMLAHKAYREGIVAAEVIAGRPARFDFQCVPSVIFTEPELGSVGWGLAEAQRRAPRAREVRFPYAALGRAHANRATDGWIKIVGDDETGLLLGVHIAGTAAGELVSEAALAIETAATVRDIAGTIHPHPTYGELMAEAALLWLGEPMHVARRPTNAPHG
ncbi:MAG: dihydrolipoyl dehydrogenase [Thermoplasmata archaeon]